MRSQCEAAAQKEKLLLSDMRRARGDMTTEADRKADNARAARAAAIDEDPVSPRPPCIFLCVTFMLAHRARGRARARAVPVTLRPSVRGGYDRGGRVRRC